MLLALKDSLPVDPATALASVADSGEARDLRWAIGDLRSLVNGSGIDQAPAASSTNLERMRWLLDNNR